MPQGTPAALTGNFVVEQASACNGGLSRRVEFLHFQGSVRLNVE
jgi:hypothetical protein